MKGILQGIILLIRLERERSEDEADLKIMLLVNQESFQGNEHRVTESKIVQVKISNFWMCLRLWVITGIFKIS